MSHTLHMLLSEFSRHAGCAAIECDSEGSAQFLCNGRHRIHLLEDQASNLFHMFALAGYFLCGEETEIPLSFDDEWSRSEVATENFVFSLRRHHNSGAVIAATSASMMVMDSTVFNIWTEKFIDRLLASSSFLLPGPHKLETSQSRVADGLESDSAV